MKRFSLFLAAGAAWLVAIELGCYAYLRFVPSRFNHLGYYLHGMTVNFHPLFKPEGGTPTQKYYPYVGFFREGRWEKTLPPVGNLPDGWVFVQGTDPEGRDLYAPMDKPRGTLRIVTLGGSTMAGMGQGSERMSIPSQLGALLRARHPGRDIEVLNGACYTYIAAEEMVLLSTKMILFRPDVVVVLDGHNEFGRAYYLPYLPPLWGQFQEFMVRTYKRTQSITGMAKQLGYLLSKRFYCLAIPRVMLYARKTHPVPAVADKAEPLDPAPYDRAIADYLLMHKTMIGIARGNGIPIVLAFQPNLTYKKPLSPEERKVLDEWNVSKPRYGEAAGLFYPRAEKAYESFRKDASTPGAMLLDLARLFEKNPETLYVDSCHYNDRGAELLARALLPAVEKALRLQAPR